MSFKFKYRTIGQFKRPIIPIKFRHEGMVFNYLALIDSGADFNMFGIDVALALGIDVTKLQKVGFLGIKKNSTGQAWYTIVEIGIEDYFFEAPVLFSDSISPSGYGIVGQQGFFDHFKVLFDYKKGEVELKTK